VDTQPGASKNQGTEKAEVLLPLQYDGGRRAEKSPSPAFQEVSSHCPLRERYERQGEGTLETIKSPGRKASTLPLLGKGKREVHTARSVFLFPPANLETSSPLREKRSAQLKKEGKALHASPKTLSRGGKRGKECKILPASEKKRSMNKL